MSALHERSFPMTAEKVVKYTTWAHGIHGLKASTITGYLRGPAIKSWLKSGIHWRQEKGRFAYEAQQVLKGCARIDARDRPTTPQSRPMSHPILERMLGVLDKNCYDDVLFGAVAAVMYFAGARADEITTRSKLHISLKANDVVLEPAVGKLTDVVIRQRKSKAKQAGPVVVITLPRTGGITCPVRWVSAYLGVRPVTSTEGAFFCGADGEPYGYRIFLEKHLRNNLRRAGVIQPEQYGTRSFRRGMATDAAELEVQPHQLKRLGRWKSMAYQTYIDQRTQDLRQIRKRLAALKQK